jgi:hypothetical protein
VPDAAAELVQSVAYLAQQSNSVYNILEVSSSLPVYNLFRVGDLATLVRQPRHTKEIASKLGNEIYERDIRPLVEPDSIGKFVAIDIETGAWEMDDDMIVAGDRLFDRVPDAQTWMTRVGYAYVCRFGAGRARRSS